LTNHWRTLLLNLSGADRPSPSYPGEEYVPPGFRPLPLPPEVVTPRRVIFGQMPDRAMMNYRLRELAAVVHGTELAEYVYALDPRVTYWPPRSGLTWPEGFDVSATSGDGSLTFVGGQLPVEQFGRLKSQWRVEVLGAGSVRVRYIDFASGSQQEQDFPYDDPVPLPGSPLSVRVIGEEGDAWTVNGLAKPDNGMPEIVAVLESAMGPSGAARLFGQDPAEPMLTFRNLWRDHPETPYRLGGVAMALAYRADAIWRR
jgi:hypothetical protein